MACKTETKQIDDHEYSVTQWPAEKSITMKFRLVKVFGASLTMLASENKNEVENFSLAIQTLFSNTEPEELFNILKSCIVGTACDGRKITETSFNELFSGDDLMEVYQVFIFVLQVNYSNLFKGQLADRLLAKVKENL